MFSKLSNLKDEVSKIKNLKTKILDSLAVLDDLESNYDNEKTMDKLVELFADINALHPFREGNGRAQRVFIESLAKINGLYLDLTNVSKEDMIIASHDSISGNYDKLKSIPVELIEADLLTIDDNTLKHHSLRLSSLIFSYLMR